MTYEKMIFVSSDTLETINQMLEKATEEIYEEYGLKCDEQAVTYTAKFPDGKEMDISLVIGNNSPYTQAVLYDKDNELVCSGGEDTFDGDWMLEYDDNKYNVTVFEFSEVKNKNVTRRDEIIFGEYNKLNEMGKRVKILLNNQTDCKIAGNGTPPAFGYYMRGGQHGSGYCHKKSP